MYKMRHAARLVAAHVIPRGRTTLATRSAPETEITSATSILLPAILFASSAVALWNLPTPSPDRNVFAAFVAGGTRSSSHAPSRSPPSGDAEDESAKANAGPLPSSPAFLRNRFLVGDYYVWLYKDKHGTPTSWERYSVVDARTSKSDGRANGGDGAVVIEMSTKFSEDEEFSTHHRMTVNMSRQLRARDDRRSWRIGFECRVPGAGADAAGRAGCEAGGPAGDGGWAPLGPGDNVQAFEEKFDAFTMSGAAGDGPGGAGPRGVRATVARGDADAELELVRTERHGYTGAWYGGRASGREDDPDGHLLAGVAIMKYFDEHSFSLIKVGTCTGGGIRELDIRVQMNDECRG